MTRRIMFGAILGGLGWALLPGLATAQTDHLKCYKVVDPLLLKGPAGKPPVEWLDLNSPDFGLEQCRVISGFRLFCVPATKTVTQPLERKFKPPGGAYQSFTPAPFAGENLTEDKICYKIKCDNQMPSPPNPSLGASDQFGERTFTKLKPYLLCGPARQKTTFTFTMDQSQETPPTGSTATGSCTGVLNASQTSFQLDCTHNVVNPTLAHIHKGAPGVAGPIVFPLPSAVSPISATWNLSPSDVSDLLAGLLYVNVHSNNCGSCSGGEIRGQIQ
jgi:CHRD domain-containing protein